MPKLDKINSQRKYSRTGKWRKKNMWTKRQSGWASKVKLTAALKAD